MILAPRGSAGLGFGIPAAIGAACARPDTTIWALCGDHGVSYSIGELATAVHYGLNIKVLVFQQSRIALDRSLPSHPLSRKRRALPLGQH